mmetsp:Transcript_36016/g.32390  ORF Transcript_36016/g.32390 Transcript_36016/m.32390 type:complete len:122 (+) Transcript_36016:356-721(+)
MVSTQGRLNSPKTQTQQKTFNTLNTEPFPQERPSQRAYVGLPSHQKFEENKDNIQDMQHELTELSQIKKNVENELFKFGNHGGNREQRRKKAQLEYDLEAVDHKIDEIKIKLRRYDALATK